MNYFPSPPPSPTMNPAQVFCGSCSKPLSSSWYCSDCHIKCKTCNRFLTHRYEQCTRCTLPRHNTNKNKYYYYFFQ
ncbi:hypothetical protein BY458DRAFT_525418 [Sporodiniella umbellata]|nr:hypothetical protein BY458DRAFT_525418 [Sporodiniella umbellata]